MRERWYVRCGESDDFVMVQLGSDTLKWCVILQKRVEDDEDTKNLSKRTDSFQVSFLVWYSAETVMDDVMVKIERSCDMKNRWRLSSKVDEDEEDNCCLLFFCAGSILWWLFSKSRVGEWRLSVFCYGFVEKMKMMENSDWRRVDSRCLERIPDPEVCYISLNSVIVSFQSCFSVTQFFFLLWFQGLKSIS